MNAARYYFGIVSLHLRKELQLEWRSRDAIIGMLFFTLLIAVVFSLAFDPTSNPTLARQISGGIAWIGLLFAATTSLNGSWQTRAAQRRPRRASPLPPPRPPPSSWAKPSPTSCSSPWFRSCSSPFFVLFYNIRPLGQASLLWLILPLGTWALVLNGTFFSALSLRSRSRDLLLPLILFPISIPALLAVVNGTTSVITGAFEPHALDPPACRLRHHLHRRGATALRHRPARGITFLANSGIHAHNFGRKNDPESPALSDTCKRSR